MSGIISKIRKRGKKVRKYAAEKVRHLRYPQKYRTIDFFVRYLSESETITVNEKAKQLCGFVVPQVCTCESRYFPEGSVSLVLSDEDVPKAIERGASVLLTNKDLVDFPCIISENPLCTYAKMCRYYRDLQSGMKVTAVTGSIGKTTAKNMIGEVYKLKYKTFYTDGTNNTKKFIGFVVQHIPSWAEMLLQEVDESGPGETEWISEMLNPDIVVITAIDKSHFQYFENAEKIVENVCSITKRMNENGTVIINKDEFDRVDLLSGRKVVTVSSKCPTPDADYYASDITMDNGGLKFTVNVKATAKRYEVRLTNMYAPHNVISALYAFAAGVCEGIAPEVIVKGLESFRTSGVRQNVVRDSNNGLIYADCYNAVGRSMKSAIDACDSIPVAGKRIAVLGDVEETGSESEQMHKDIVRYVDESKFDVLFTIGEKIRNATDEVAVRNDLSVRSFLELEDLCAELKSLLQKDDLVLFKASHAGNLDKAIKIIWPEMAKDLFDDPDEKYEKWFRTVLSY